MKIALYSKNVSREDADFLSYVVKFLENKQHEILIHRHFGDYFPSLPVFYDHSSLKEHTVDFLFSLGGDGTLLDAASIVGNSDIPIVGINTGRIGFLTNINQKDFEEAFAMLQQSLFTIEERALLRLECEALPAGSCFALNDITVHSSNSSYLSAIKVWIDGQKVNTYWGDGLIIATPTGSTAYSLSCGGPIILPSTHVNVITPIASHSLSVRPIVVSADKEIILTIEGRNDSFTLTYDSHRVELPNASTITISKETFTIKTVRLDSTDFFSVIREKLMWGLDKRNETGC